MHRSNKFHCRHGLSGVRPQALVMPYTEVCARPAARSSTVLTAGLVMHCCQDNQIYMVCQQQGRLSLTHAKFCAITAIQPSSISTADCILKRLNTCSVVRATQAVSVKYAEFCALTAARLNAPPLQHPPPQPLYPGQRLRLAYVSSDFGNHPLSHLMASVFGSHDRSRIEVCTLLF